MNVDDGASDLVDDDDFGEEGEIDPDAHKLFVERRSPCCDAELEDRSPSGARGYPMHCATCGEGLILHVNRGRSGWAEVDYLERTFGALEEGRPDAIEKLAAAREQLRLVLRATWSLGDVVREVVYASRDSALPESVARALEELPDDVRALLPD